MANHKIGGKQRGLDFGLLAIEYYCDALGRDIEALDDIFLGDKPEIERLRSVSTLVWAAMVAHSELSRKEIDFTLAQVKQWVGDLDIEVFNAILEDFKKSKYMGKTIESYYFAPIEGEQEEKKPVKKQGSRKS